MGNALPCLASHDAKASKNLKKPKNRQNRRMIKDKEQIVANLIDVQEKDVNQEEGDSHDAKASKNLKKPKNRQNRRKIMDEEQILAKLIHVQEKDVKQEEEEEEEEEEKNKQVIRVKMVLTKKEAAHLLSMFAHQNDTTSTVRMLAEIEKRSRRVNSSQGSWRPMLESIPEIDIS